MRDQGGGGVSLIEMGAVAALKLLRVRGEEEVASLRWVCCRGVTGELCQRVLEKLKPDDTLEALERYPGLEEGFDL